MRKSRYSEEQIIWALQEVESGRTVKDVCRDHGIATGTYYSWKAKYGGMDVKDARRRIEAWRVDDNQLRPQSSLGDLTPSEFARLAGLRPTLSPSTSRTPPAQ